MLGYTAKTFERMYRVVNFFSTKQQKLIVPEFCVLFNGTPALPDKSVIRLSDSYITALPENSAEIVVKTLDVDYNKDKEILKRAPTLHDYSRFIQKDSFNAAYPETLKRWLKLAVKAETIEEFEASIS